MPSSEDIFTSCVLGGDSGSGGSGDGSCVPQWAGLAQEGYRGEQHPLWFKKKKKKFQVKQKKVKGGEADFLAEMYFIRAWEVKWTFLEKGTVNGWKGEKKGIVVIKVLKCWPEEDKPVSRSQAMVFRGLLRQAFWNCQGNSSDPQLLLRFPDRILLRNWWMLLKIAHDRKTWS